MQRVKYAAVLGEALGTWLGRIVQCCAGVGEVSTEISVTPYVGHCDEQDQLLNTIGPICIEVFEILNFKCL